MSFSKYLMKGFDALKFVGCVVILVLIGLNNAYSFTLQLDDLSNSYSGCYFSDNGDGTSTVSTVISYKTSWGHTAGNIFLSRGILVYSYDKNGQLNSKATPAIKVIIDGVGSSTNYAGSDYVIFKLTGDSVWTNTDAHFASVQAVVRNDLVSDWPAIAIRAGNYTDSDDVAEIKGVAYISKTGPNNGSCVVLVDPGTPPPQDINISVSAPDWNLGELEQGISDTSLSRADQMLCFSYDAVQSQKQKFTIGASSTNGVINNRYRLQNLSDASQVVPYSLILDSGGSRIQLPGNSTEMVLDASGRTCFVPTFTTEVGGTVKEGDYSDVLTFTVTTKP